MFLVVPGTAVLMLHMGYSLGCDQFHGIHLAQQCVADLIGAQAALDSDDDHAVVARG